MKVLPVEFASSPLASSTSAASTGTCSMYGSSFTLIDWVLIGFVIVFSVFAFVYVYTSRQQVSRIENYAQRSEKTTVKYFKMPSCMFCKRFDDVWERVSRTMSSHDDSGGSNSIIFDGPIDITSKKGTSSADITLARSRCNGYPCYMTMRGDSIVASESGYKDQTAFENWITQNQ